MGILPVLCHAEIAILTHLLPYSCTNLSVFCSYYSLFSRLIIKSSKTLTVPCHAAATSLNNSEGRLSCGCHHIAIVLVIYCCSVVRYLSKVELSSARGSLPCAILLSQCSELSFTTGTKQSSMHLCSPILHALYLFIVRCTWGKLVYYNHSVVNWFCIVLALKTRTEQSSTCAMPCHQLKLLFYHFIQQVWGNLSHCHLSLQFISALYSLWINWLSKLQPSIAA